MFSKNSSVSSNIVTQLIDKLGNLLITGELVIDSRKANANTIFCAYPGTSNDGRNYISDVINKGSKFILWEKGIDFPNTVANLSVTNLIYYVGILAAAKYNNPSEHYNMIGVTGTNGKTSISHWLSQAYTSLGKTAGVIGTTGAGVYPNTTYNDSTTPDPLTVQKILSEFATKRADVVTMEVSSHALDQGRVNGVNFTTAIFTNLTQDHLDYHGNMENYYLAKRDLFYWHGLKNAVINADDSYGERLINELTANNRQLQIIDYGINSGKLRASNLKIDLSGMSFDLSYNNQTISTQVGVIGQFNVYNILAVAATLILNGHSLYQIANVLAGLTPVCGRMDALIAPNKPLIVVDFSHTPDSLEKALLTLRQIEHSGRLYCVFGCGGNRDAKKRPLMGEIANRLADITIITSDNPRFEKPEEIIEQIQIGVNSNISKNNSVVIVNRQDAITYALNLAEEGDIVLIAGKGHETYQEVQGIKHPFSDFNIARSLLGI